MVYLTENSEIKDVFQESSYPEIQNVGLNLYMGSTYARVNTIINITLFKSQDI